jgi:chromosome segregation ATPase
VLDERGVYFVPLKLAAKSKTKLAIQEETPSRRVVEIFSDAARRALTLFLTGTAAGRDPKLKAALAEVLKLQDQLGRLEEELGRLRETKEAYGEREEQVRENLNTLGKSLRNEDLRRKLLATMNELEGKLNDVNRRTVSLNVERSELRDRLAVLIKQVSFEGP